MILNWFEEFVDSEEEEEEEEQKKEYVVEPMSENSALRM